MCTKRHHSLQRLVRRGEHDRGARFVGIGNPRLRTVDYPLVAVRRGGGSRGAGIAAVAWLAQAEAPDPQPPTIVLRMSCPRRYESLLQFVGTECVDGVQVQAVMGRHDDADARASAADLLHGDGVR